MMRNNYNNITINILVSIQSLSTTTLEPRPLVYKKKMPINI